MTSRSEGVNLLQGFGLKLAWESGLKVIPNVLLIRLISLFVTGIQFDQLLYLIEGDWDYSASPSPSPFSRASKSRYKSGIG